MQDEKHLAALRTYWKRHQAFPAMAKLCDVVGLSSSSSVFALIGRLVDAGYLDRVEGRIAPTRKFFSRPAGDFSISKAFRRALPRRRW